jgi:hypothetical protein
MRGRRKDGGLMIKGHKHLRRAVGVLAGAALLIGLGQAGGSDDAPGPRGPARTQAQAKTRAQARAGEAEGFRPREAAEVLQALRELADAVREDGENRDGDTTSAALKRPERTVTPPTLTSGRIDEMVQKGLAEAKAPAAKRTTDEQFARRVYLDLTGKAPSVEELREFVASPDRHKRSALIDRLLDSPDYAANWARYWRDVIRYHATVNQPRLLDYPSLETWLTGKLAANAPWDEIARELIAASGDSGENGAAVFTAAHMAQPVEIAGEVSRIFLGVQIQCAQCHDHPSDPWKREQFHEFAAFFAGVQSRRNPPPERGVVINVRKGTPRYTMPDLKDPSKSIPVEPRFFLASSESPIPARLSVQERRELAAALITSRDNPWFAKALVNRVWYVLMGDAFVTPVDDLGPNREAKFPELFDELSSQFAQGGYDLKWLLRTVMNTKTYQRQARATNSAPGLAAFAANCASRLRSDQIFDQLTAAGVRLAPPPRRGPDGQPQAGGAAAALLRRNGPRGVFDLVFGADPSTPNEDVLGTIPQALFLMNSPAVAAAARAQKGTVLGQILEENPDNRAALEAIYLRVLSRRPSDDEVKLCGRYLEQVGNRREAFEDIYWSLLNSTEFLSRR